MEDIRLIRARTKLLLRYPFFGHLALNLKLRTSTTVKTVSTDGKKLLYNPDFVRQQDEQTLLTIVAHEVLHCALGHLWRRGTRSRDRWNIAADFAANSVLKQEGFYLPPDCYFSEKFEKLSAEQIYAQLPEPTARLGKMCLLDSHEDWEKELAAVLVADETELSRQWRDFVNRAITHSQLFGKELPKSVNKLRAALARDFNWRELLRRYVLQSIPQNFRLLPPNKRHLWRKLYLPSTCGEQLDLVIGIDTSGSISDSQFTQFMAVVRGITDQFPAYQLHFFFCDAQIHDEMIISTFDEWPDFFPKRSGGTDFCPVFDRIESLGLRIMALLYLTDTYGSFPDYAPAYPVIWVMPPGGSVPWGQSVEMEEIND